MNLYVRDLRDTSTSKFAIEAYNSFLSVVPAKCSLVTDQHCLPLQRLLSKAKKQTNKNLSLARMDLNPGPPAQLVFTISENGLISFQN